jgi:phage head maturation protease
MTEQMQYRSMAEATVVDVDGHECLARLMHSERDGTPIPDRHGTSWAKSTFDDGWRRRMPKFLLQHRPESVVGKVVGAQSTKTAFELRAAFSPLDVNPDARRAWHGLSRGELDQFSFGFRDAKTVPSPVPSHRRKGIRHHISATMMELSAVTFGSLETELAGIRADTSTGGFVSVSSSAYANQAETALKAAVAARRAGDPAGAAHLGNLAITAANLCYGAADGEDPADMNAVARATAAAGQAADFLSERTSPADLGDARITLERLHAQGQRRPRRTARQW